MGQLFHVVTQRLKNHPTGCVPFGESKNGFLILDLPDFAVERNVKSEIEFVTLVTFRQRVQLCTTASQKMTCFLQFGKLCDYTVQNLAVGSSNSDDGTYKTDKERSTLKIENYLKNVGQFDPVP